MNLSAAKRGSLGSTLDTASLQPNSARRPSAGDALDVRSTSSGTAPAGWSTRGSFQAGGTMTPSSDGSMVIADLAKEAKKHSIAARFPGIPIAAIVTTLIIGSLLAVALVLGILFDKASQDAVHELSERIIYDAVKQVVSGIDEVKQTGVEFAALWEQSPSIRQIMDTSASPPPLRLFEMHLPENGGEIFAQGYQMTKSVSYLSNTGCITKKVTVTEKNGVSIDPAERFLFVGTYRDNDNGMIGTTFVDYDSSATWVHFLDAQKPSWPLLLPGFANFPTRDATKGANPVESYPFAVETESSIANSPVYELLTTAEPVRGVQWAVSMYLGVMQLSPAFAVYDYVDPDKALYACGFSFNVEQALTPLMKTLRPTTNSKIFLMERATGYLIASDTPGSTYETLDALLNQYKRFQPHQSTDAETAAVGTALRDYFDGYSNIPSSTTEITRFEQKINSKKWIINLESVAADPSEWILVVAMPRADFFGNVDKTRKTSVGIAAGIGVLGAVLSAILSFIVLRPLARLAHSMKQLTKFDFSSLEGGALDARSHILEIRKLQQTFSTMVNAFAAGIRKNKALVGGQMGIIKSGETGGARFMSSGGVSGERKQSIA
ncbi:hypothetical protein HDU85_001174 [Gaertneriomyces sp. JEL0708]|nr:hypothetical protein HDU85_001174 [Gaertneriomyces sp. JEL0708]